MFLKIFFPEEMKVEGTRLSVQLCDWRYATPAGC